MGEASVYFDSFIYVFRDGRVGLLHKSDFNNCGRAKHKTIVEPNPTAYTTQHTLNAGPWASQWMPMLSGLVWLDLTENSLTSRPCESRIGSSPATLRRDE